MTVAALDFIAGITAADSASYGCQRPAVAATNLIAEKTTNHRARCNADTAWLDLLLDRMNRFDKATVVTDLTCLCRALNWGLLL